MKKEVYSKELEKCECEGECKTLNVVDGESLKTAVSDVQVHGDPMAWVCIGKASSGGQGWMKSTKVMEIEGAGCLVQVSTQQGSNVAEALQFVPGVKLNSNKTGLEKI